MRLSAACVLLLAGAGPSATAQSPAVPAAPAAPALPSPAAADRPDRTPSGATFTAPAGWTEAGAARLVELAAPERDYRLALVDVGAAPDASAAARAWALWRPAQTRPPKLVTARPPRDGWDERRVIDYEVSPNEKRDLHAIAFRHGAAWTVLLADGAEGTGEKRLAAIGLVRQSLRPAGYARETFAGRTAHPMDAARIAELKGSWKRRSSGSACPAPPSRSPTTGAPSGPAGSACAGSAPPRRSTRTACSRSPPTPRAWRRCCSPG